MSADDAVDAADRTAGERSVLDGVLYGLIRPRSETPVAHVPALIANRPGGLTMDDALRDEIAHSSSFDMSVAFVNSEAVLQLFQDFKDHRDADPDSPSRLITSTKQYFNRPRDFRQLLHLQRETGIDVRVWQGPRDDAPSPQGRPFHPKGYVFRRSTADGVPYYDLYVGSSNLTSIALTLQREWNLRIPSLPDGDLVDQFRREIDAQVDESVPLTEEWIERYEEDFRKYAPPRREILRELENRDREIEPNAMQREALESLRALRERGEHRAIIVSATGTGKTYLSAFDVRACRPKRMLYLAQQRMILDAAMRSYRKVLGCDESDMGLFTGTDRQQDRRYVFATVQTMRNALDAFAPDEFDYVLVDEVHHAGAEGYRRIIDHFRDAGFMLGMTATPERMDGINIFELFGHNIAYEIRLQKALDENMLCPFHYYGVAEYLGAQDDGRPARRIDVGDDGLTDEDSAQLRHEIRRLATKERVRYIIDKLQEYGQYGVPVTGLVFCSRQEEAHELSRLFNMEWNQQAERPYRTAAVTSTDADGRPIPQRQGERMVSELVARLERGELDYLFTVDKFNEGVDIPSVNQIVMLRSTKSSVVFTQQLGRGLRRFPHKESVVVIDFIGNYANNYLIPVALYGNTGDRDRARRNLQRRSIGLSSISFDPIARDRVLRSLDAADWSDMKRLTERYRQVRYELGRIPMLTDIYAFDPSLPYTLASKRGNYLEFVRSRELSLGRRGRGAANDDAAMPEAVGDVENAILKMATELLLPGLRPHEPVILGRLCGFTDDGPANGHRSDADVWHAPAAMDRETLKAAVRSEFPQADQSDVQFDSAIRVLDTSYFREGNRTRFGGVPLIVAEPSGGDGGMRYRLSPRFASMLASSRTFRLFLDDTLRTALADCRDLFRDARDGGRPLDRAFLYERKYSLDDVMRLCGWERENNPQNVGGYCLDRASGTMPIFVKYATSQYADEFIGPQEMRYFSKNGRTPLSPEFRWVRENAGADWGRTHFVPLFVMRKAEAETPEGRKIKGSRYYYVGHVVDFGTPRLTHKPNASGTGEVKVTLSTLRLARPIEPELYRHLIG